MDVHASPAALPELQTFLSAFQVCFRRPEGRAALERAVDRRPPPGRRVRRAVFRNATAAYLGSLFVVTSAAVAAAVLWARHEGAAEALQLWVGLLALLCLLMILLRRRPKR